MVRTVSTEGRNAPSWCRHPRATATHVTYTYPLVNQALSDCQQLALQTCQDDRQDVVLALQRDTKMGAAHARRRSSGADHGAVDMMSSSGATDLPLRVAERQWDDSVSQVFPWLYVGQQSAALNLGLVRKLGIRAFINCSNRAAPEFLGQERDLTCLGVPVHDDPKEAISQHFERAAQWARTKDGLTLLVFCMAGISRSATIALVLLMKNRTHAATRTPHRAGRAMATLLARRAC